MAVNSRASILFKLFVAHKSFCSISVVSVNPDALESPENPRAHQMILSLEG